MEAKSRGDARGHSKSDPDRTPDLRRLQQLFERSRAAMLIADDERRYTGANAAACELFETTRERLIGARIDDFTTPEVLPELEPMWRTFLESGAQAGIFELLLPSGARRFLEYSSTTNIAPGQHLSVLVEQRPDVPPLDPGEPEAQRHGGVLTPREREVLGHVALGASTLDIADRLVISTETARTHVKHAMEKLGARNRAHAVAIALRSDEIELPS
jgi:PAS domain S-box-containing protein